LNAMLNARRNRFLLENQDALSLLTDSANSTLNDESPSHMAPLRKATEHISYVSFMSVSISRVHSSS
jgi:hypothetical protein